LHDRTEIASDATPSQRMPTRHPASWREGLAVYLQPRVLIVLCLGFSSGLPLALSGSTLLVWMRESGVDLGTSACSRWSARPTR
jgi:PAT family beta-lactamase induction signal transducer AmpG